MADNDHVGTAIHAEAKAVAKSVADADADASETDKTSAQEHHHYQDNITTPTEPPTHPPPLAQQAPPPQQEDELKREKEKKKKTMVPTSHARPNAVLTLEERHSKKQRKKHFQWLQRKHKMETRVRFARQRKDAVLERQFQNELENFLRQGPPPIAAAAAANDNNDNDTAVTANLHPWEEDMRAFILQVTHPLLRALEHHSKKKPAACQSNSDDSSAPLAPVTSLLRHMTKGTQTRDMFTVPEALCGYVGQKFVSRAMLLAKSWAKLAACDTTTAAAAWNLIQNEATSFQCCSIGCGPGCDALGFLALVRQARRREANCTTKGKEPSSVSVSLASSSSSSPSSSHGSSLQDRSSTSTTSGTPVSLVLLDYAIASWQDVVLQHWSPIVQSVVSSSSSNETNQKEPISVSRIDFGYCDITKPLDSPDNAQARELVFFRQQQVDDTNRDQEDNGGAKNTQLLVISFSYLLSETRHAWDDFVLPLLQRVTPPALFYFAEPTPWQLHRFMALVVEAKQEEVAFVWLDSSMHEPSLQSLNGRIGPAVLMATKL